MRLKIIALSLFILGSGFFLYARFKFKVPTKAIQSAAKAVGKAVSKGVNKVKETVSDFMSFSPGNIINMREAIRKKVDFLRRELQALIDDPDKYLEERGEILTDIKNFFIETKKELQKGTEEGFQYIVIEFAGREQYEQSVADMDAIREQYKDDERAKRAALNAYAEVFMVDLMVHHAKDLIVPIAGEKVWENLKPSITEYAQSVFVGIDYFKVHAVPEPAKETGAVVLDIVQPIIVPQQPAIQQEDIKETDDIPQEESGSEAVQSDQNTSADISDNIPEEQASQKPEDTDDQKPLLEKEPEAVTVVPPIVEVQKPVENLDEQTLSSEKYPQEQVPQNQEKQPAGLTVPEEQPLPSGITTERPELKPLPSEKPAKEQAQQIQKEPSNELSIPKDQPLPPGISTELPALKAPAPQKQSESEKTPATEKVLLPGKQIHTVPGKILPSVGKKPLPGMHKKPPQRLTR